MHKRQAFLVLVVSLLIVLIASKTVHARSMIVPKPSPSPVVATNRALRIRNYPPMKKEIDTTMFYDVRWDKKELKAKSETYHDVCVGGVRDGKELMKCYTCAKDRSLILAAYDLDDVPVCLNTKNLKMSSAVLKP